MFDNYLVRKQVVLDYKMLILNSSHIGFSQRGQKMEILSLHVFGQIGLEMLFDDH